MGAGVLEVVDLDLPVAAAAVVEAPGIESGAAPESLASATKATGSPGSATAGIATALSDEIVVARLNSKAPMSTTASPSPSPSTMR